MTLTNRLTAFSLATLGAVLVGFSVTLYLLARVQLDAQLHDGVTATLDTLTAPVEVEPDGLEWDPKRRTLAPAPVRPGEAWAIFDSAGGAVDGDAGWLHEFVAVGPGGSDAERGGRHWQVVARRLTHPSPVVVDRRDAEQPGDERYAALTFVAATPRRHVDGTLRRLGRSLAVASLGVWLVAAVAGRWVVRRALAPVRRMAEGARAMTPDDLTARLPVPAPRDELRDLATTFNDSLARIQDSFERQRRFTGEASHQLRTPLTALRGQLEVALRRDREPDEYRRVLATAVGQAGRLQSIVETLLFLARADAEVRLPDLAQVDLSHWLPGRLRETWGGHARFDSITLKLPPSACPVAAQPELLGQALDNLVDNALKYSDPGTPVTVEVVRDESATTLAVEDSGPGIAASDAARVFEPFFRSADARRRGVAGVGLGLAVTRRIVVALGGEVVLVAGRVAGTRVELRFPHPIA